MRDELRRKASYAPPTTPLDGIVELRIAACGGGDPVAAVAEGIVVKFVVAVRKSRRKKDRSPPDV